MTPTPTLEDALRELNSEAYRWAPEGCIVLSASECFDIQPNDAAAMIVSHVSYDRLLEMFRLAIDQRDSLRLQLAAARTNIDVEARQRNSDAELIKIAMGEA